MAQMRACCQLEPKSATNHLPDDVHNAEPFPDQNRKAIEIPSQRMAWLKVFLERL